MQIAELIRFHDMSRSRRIRTRLYWDEFEISRARASWTNKSPVIGCTIHISGCADCLSRTQATDVSGEDMWCPQTTNAYTEERCFWGDDGINGGLCDDCFRQAEFVCGLGSHEFRACIKDNHHAEEIVQHCAECEPCLARHENGEDWPHCRQACPSHVQVCG